MEVDITKRFANNVHAVCIHKHILIGELENSVGVTLGYISRLRKGGRCTSLSLAYYVSKYLNMSLDELLNSDLEAKFKSDIYRAELEKLEKRANELKRLLEEKE